MYAKNSSPRVYNNLTNSRQYFTFCNHHSLTKPQNNVKVSIDIKVFILKHICLLIFVDTIGECG